ncbi:hypothetical protein, partial [Burkholderia multivorans]|uniref:hypothetical protein n=1 Tax=Burkholderia multivorans TaxID=87883 RepID=UPI001C615F5A
FASSSRKFEAISPATSEVGPLISVSLARAYGLLVTATAAPAGSDVHAYFMRGHPARTQRTLDDPAHQPEP